MDAEMLARLDSVRRRLAVEPIDLRAAADLAYLSPFHFHRLFRGAFGRTPHAYAAELRLERARRLLLESDLTVTEIAFAVGYESVGAFCTRFARESGASPSEFRRGARRLWALGGIRSHRFVPLCYVQHRKIEEPRAMAARIR